MTRVDIESMIGQKYGEWTVLGIEWIERNGNRSRALKCVCSCGNIKVLRKIDLLRGKTNSCGCKLLKTENLTGRRIGEWKVIRYLKLGKWLCECSCGNVREVSGQELRNGRSKSCGCMKGKYIEEKKLIDITGFKSGKITVLRRSDNHEKEKETGSTIWVCQCECGNIKEISKTAIISHGQKTCGECERGGFIDIDGMKFGKWTVVGRDESRTDGVFWKVVCECGNTSSLQSANLRGGYSKSCGCLRHDVSSSFTGMNHPGWKGTSKINAFLRKSLMEWKKESMAKCEYKCVISGEKFRDIHHLYPVNKMIDEIFEITGFPIFETMGNYSSNQIDEIQRLFLKLHKKYGLGVCLTRKVHTEFHHLYGTRNFTPENFYDFYYSKTGYQFDKNILFKEAS